MILIGDDLISYEDVSRINEVSEIKNSKSNSTIICNYDENIVTYCHDNALSYGVIIKNLKELIYASLLNAKYIICNKELSIDAQKIAENYIFDSKILVVIENNDEIQWVAQNEIDGAIYKKII